MNPPLPPTRPRCALVGAGPGDPELLTLKAVDAIRTATVLLVDDLVSDAVVALASAEARVIRVGKRGGCRSTPQAFIERLMIGEALRGERVVRLKGGDPTLFGRCAEEADALRAAGIEVEIVNGITAGIAAGHALGVSLTDRRHAHGVVFITGHARAGEPPIHWPAIATAAAQGLTLVIYMGISHCAAIQEGLLDGLAASTPVAIVQNVSLPNQRLVVSRLDRLAATVSDHAITSPAIIVVGDIVRGVDASMALAA